MVKIRLSAKGFTLIELMITIVVVAILAAIAVPTYFSTIARSDIRTAQADLSSLSLIFTSAYQRRLEYPLVSAATTPADKLQKIKDALQSPSGGGQTVNLTSKSFNFEATISTSSTYTFKAIGTGKLSNCWVSINQDNLRAASNATDCKFLTGAWL